MLFRSDTPKDVKNARLKQLVAKIDEHVWAINQSMVGHIETVMMESMARDGQHLQGRTENGRVVLIDVNTDQAKRLLGKLIAVTITEAMPHSLRGELLIKE